MSTRPRDSQTKGRVVLVLFALSYIALSLTVCTILYLRWIKVEAAVYAYENRGVRTWNELNVILARIDKSLPDPAIKSPTMKTIDGITNNLRLVADDLRKLREMHAMRVPISER